MSLLARLSRLFSRRRYERDLDEELAFHVDCRVSELVARGMPFEAATRQARIELGMSGMHRQAVREAHGLAFIDTWSGELRRAATGLAASPMFTATAVIVLGVAIGVNLMLFALWQNYLATPPRTASPGALYDLEVRGADGRFVPPLTLAEISLLERTAGNDVRGIAGSRQSSLVLGGPEPRAVHGTVVTAGYLPMLDLAPRQGRLLVPGDFSGDAANVVLGARLFDRLAAEGLVLGGTLLLGGETVTVVGVLPEAASGLEPFPPQFLMTPALDARIRRTAGNAEPARLQVTIQEATGADAVLAAWSMALQRLETRTTDDERIGRVRLLARDSQLPAGEAEDFRGVAGPVWLLATLLLLAACANVGNLMLARATVRRQELAIRASLGASRGQLLRLLMLESLLLALGAGAVGLLACTALVDPAHRYAMSMLVALGIEPLSIAFQPALAGWALLLAVIACLGFGTLPALAVTGGDLAQAARRDASLFGGRLPAARLRSLLLSAQVATSLVLLVVAALVVDATRRGDQVDIGYPVSALVDLRGRTADPALRERLLGIPGVRDVGGTASVPLIGVVPRSPARVDGQALSLATHRVDDRYFSALSLEPILGRGFRAEEAEQRAPVAVISHATATRLWPDASPLDRTITFVGDDGGETRVQVVGVVRDVVNGLLVQGLDATAVYLPGALGQPDMGQALVRVDPARVPETKAAIADACRLSGQREPCLPWTLAELSALYRLPLAVASTLASALGAVALLISAVGLFGVVRYQVAARTREFGIRQALGAPTQSVLRLVLGDALRQVRLGFVAGLLASIAVSALLAQVIGPGRAFPALAYAGVPLLITAVTLLAAMLPAWRATRVPAMEALRDG